MTVWTRRRLAKEFTRRNRASVAEILAQPASDATATTRIAFTGPPGAGKSNLIATWGLHRVERQRRLAVLAIDPTSPISGGAILGDRVRMEALAAHPLAFVRSFGSGVLGDGVCLNVVGLLDLVAEAGFDDAVLETVGVGQTTYEVRDVVRTLVLVLGPDSGDTVQAMKAGILELADLFVVHKADLPQADRLLREIRSIVDIREASDEAWRPPVLAVSSLAKTGIEELDKAIDAHGAWSSTHVGAAELAKRGRRFQLKQVLARNAAEFLNDESASERSLSEAYASLLRRCADRN